MPLRRILAPDSVAVIGASREETKRGYQAIRTLVEERYEGRIYPVNPREENILGLRCYPSVTAIEETVDLALIVTPARTVPGLLEECAAKGVAGAVLVAGGFAEAGEEGRELQRQIAEIARRTGIRLIGPNTSGIMNLRRRMNLVGLRGVPVGDIALLSQSGNMALSLFTEAGVKSRKGFSYYIGVGNEADIRFHEYLDYLVDDERTRAILMYVEGMRDGRSFLQTAYETTRRKPVVLLKGGRSETGRNSIGSHTGALAGMSRVALTALRRAGVTVVEESDQLFPVTEALASLPPIRNNNVAILADGGGHATIAADVLTDLGVGIRPLGKSTRAALRRILPPTASVQNPVDVAGATDSDPTLFAECARILLSDRKVGGLLLVGLFGGYGLRFAESLAFAEEDAAHQMGKLVRKLDKPIVVHSLYKFSRPHALELLRYYDIVVNDSVEISCRCVGALAERGRYLSSREHRNRFALRWGSRARKRGNAILEAARAEGRTALLEHEARELLALHGVPVGESRLATTAREAVDAAAELGNGVAMKVVSPQILHKSDAGGVRLDVRGEKQVRAAFREILDAAREFDAKAEVRGVLVSPMARRGIEVIVGTRRDDQFGPVIMFGIGGILVEVLKDVTFRVIPLSRHGARQMVEEIRTTRLLHGYRGQPPADRAAIRSLLLTISEVAEAYPAIHEMDLNPVLVHDEGLTVVDARILLGEETPDGGP